MTLPAKPLKAALQKQLLDFISSKTTFISQH